MTKRTFGEYFDFDPGFDPIRQVVPQDEESPVFTWFKPDISAFLGSPVVLRRPTVILQQAQVFFDRPFSESEIGLRPNHWLKAMKDLEESGLIDHFLFETPWIVFAVQGLPASQYQVHLEFPPVRPWPTITKPGKIAIQFAKIAACLEIYDAQEAVEKATNSALAFAEKFGPLGYGAFIRVEDSDPNTFFYAEPLTYWMQQSSILVLLERMRLAIKGGKTVAELRAPQLGRPGADSNLRAIIGLDREITAGLKGKIPEHLARRASFILNALGPIHAVDLSKPLRLASLSNPLPPMESNDTLALAPDARVRLQNEVAAILDALIQENVQVRVLPGHATPVVQLPRNLLGVMALTTASRYAPGRACKCDGPGCGTILKGRTRVRRTNFCSDACRKRFSRSRRTLPAK